MRVRATIQWDSGPEPVVFRGDPPPEGIAVGLDAVGRAGDLFINGRRVGTAIGWPRTEYDHVYGESSDQNPVTSIFQGAQIDCVLEF